MTDSLLKSLADHALQLDRTGEWPHSQFSQLAAAGVLGWVIPPAYEGSGISQLELIRGYEKLAAACLTTTFILTQRNGACQRIAGCDNNELKQDLLPPLARGDIFATVGISHLTTSRQHIKTPAVSASVEGDEIRLSGNIPWVTGADQAQYVVTGGTCEDGRQVLVALPTDAPGVTVLPFAKLMSLTASHTASIDLDNVRLPVRYLLAGPVHEVMKQGQGGGTGSLVTSVLALGLANRSIDLIQDQGRLREDIREIGNRFASERDQLRTELYRTAEAGQTLDNPNADHLLTAAEIRQRANSLVMRVTQAGMAISKGAGFVQGHPAEMAVREAMFFLVWSCPQPVVHGVLEELTCRD